jgi:hypothetical protein
MQSNQEYEDELEHILPRQKPVRILKVTDYVLVWGGVAVGLLVLWLIVRGLYLAARELVRAL